MGDSPNKGLSRGNILPGQQSPVAAQADLLGDILSVLQAGGAAQGVAVNLLHHTFDRLAGLE